MPIAKSHSAHLCGLSMGVVTVEVDISNGLNSLSIVGLGDRAVDESKDRVSAAIKNSGYVSPKQKNQKVVVSLAPADVRKEGPSFDLAIAVAYLCAAGEVSADIEKILFLGELSLEGRLRKVCGALPILCQASKHGFDRAIIPEENSGEASLGCGIPVYTADSLANVIDYLTGDKELPRVKESGAESSANEWRAVDMMTIKGNEAAKRGLEIAAAGFHNVIMYGPPGTGKTMLANSFKTILPPLSLEESVEVTSIHSAAGVLDKSLIRNPPFRSPHHTASYAAIVGGGTIPRPGEVTLAHRGVLFLDEFPEFDSDVLEALRQPLEDGSVSIARVRGSVRFPAQCILMAAMNPCPCGAGNADGCSCKPHELRAYSRRLSGPVLDRIDIWINVSKVDYEKLSSREPAKESSSIIRERVMKARAIQADRFRDGIRRYNSEMRADDIETLAGLSDEARETLKSGAKRLRLSARAFHRVIKVARTIADLEGSGTILRPHILEAIQYRQRISGTATDQRTDSERRVSQNGREGP